MQPLEYSRRYGVGKLVIKSIMREPRDHTERQRQTKHCEVPLCVSHTKGAKPRCVSHIEQMSYVDDLLNRIEGRAETDAAVKKLGPSVADPEDLTAKEILGYLKVYGPRTILRMGRDIGDTPLVRVYSEMLRVKGIIDISENKRGSKVLTLIKKKEEK